MCHLGLFWYTLLAIAHLIHKHCPIARTPLQVLIFITQQFCLIFSICGLRYMVFLLTCSHARSQIHSQWLGNAVNWWDLLIHHCSRVLNRVFLAFIYRWNMEHLANSAWKLVYQGLNMPVTWCWLVMCGLVDLQPMGIFSLVINHPVQICGDLIWLGGHFSPWVLGPTLLGFVLNHIPMVPPLLPVQGGTLEGYCLLPLN